MTKQHVAFTHEDGLLLLRTNLPSGLHPSTLHSLICAWLAYGSDNNQTAYEPATGSSTISHLIFLDGYSLTFNAKMLRLHAPDNNLVLQETF